MQERERRRIAQDLHDRTAGALASILFGLRRLERDAPSDELGERVREVRVEVGTTIDDLRDLIADLRPKALDDFGLEPALERLCDAMARRGGIEVTCHAQRAINSVRPEAATAAYRIAQEALQNILRHAGASHAQVSAVLAGNSLQLTIDDDGVGLPHDEPFRQEGYGLPGMLERAEMVGGRLSAGASPEGGTRIHLEVPL
jgi:two-component system sensor histidine kinase UhpB